MNALKKYLSYLARFEVEKRSSPYNKKLVVALQNGKYVLNAEYANYSFASLHRVFQQAFKHIDLSSKKRILVLGCGAGSIPCIVYKEMQFSPKMVAVEIDPAVIELGKKYFDLADYEQLNVVVEDALSFMQKNTEQYDLICVDVFNGIHVPEQFLKTHFLEQCKRAMGDQGELLLNFVAHNHETKSQVKEIEAELQSVFSQTNTFKIEGINRIFWAKK